MTRQLKTFLKRLTQNTFCFFSVIMATSAMSQHPQLDLTKTVGVESCAECHEEIVDRWAESTHATSFETLIKTEAARRIAEIVGIGTNEIPVNASCVRCHYTREFRHSAPITTESISCESCHGPARDWIDEHNKRSSPRSTRVANAGALGMRHPEKIYDMAKSCFECHVVDDEQLVNHTGHPALSDGFELLSWYSGETAHNFMISSSGRSVKKHSSQLQSLPVDRKRMLFLTGKLLHLSQTLKVISRATDAPVDGTGKFIILESGRPTFAVQHSIQARQIAKELQQVQKLTAVPEIKQAIEIYEALSFKTGQAEVISKAADEIDSLAKAFTENRRGSDYAKIDPVLSQLVPRYAGNEAKTKSDPVANLGLDQNDVKKVTALVARIQSAE